MGGRLAVLDTVKAPGQFVARLKRHDRSAEAELTAMHLLHSGNRAAEIELEPEVATSRGIRKADFRIWQPGKDWTYVEVTRPDASAALKRALSVLDRITTLVLEVKREFAVEVFFNREPDDSEIEPLLEQVRRFCVSGEAEREQVQDLALLLLSAVRPGHVIPHEEPDQISTPRLGAVKYVGGGDGPRRHIVVRIPYADKRADRFLAVEARQLPTGYPGLIMVDATVAPTVLASWARIINRRFQPNIHTRISAVCLFAPSLLQVEDNLLWVPWVQLHVNPHAKFVLPQWVEQTLNEAASIFRRCRAAARTPYHAHSSNGETPENMAELMTGSSGAK
jgi:hypothetical protein